LTVDVGWAINRAQTELGMPRRLKILCQKLIVARLEVVGALIDAAKARGEIPRVMSNDLITESITGAALGHAALVLFGGRERTPDSTEKYARELVEFLYPAFTHGRLSHTL